MNLILLVEKCKQNMNFKKTPNLHVLTLVFQFYTIMYKSTYISCWSSKIFAIKLNGHLTHSLSAIILLKTFYILGTLTEQYKDKQKDKKKSFPWVKLQVWE